MRSAQRSKSRLRATRRSTPVQCSASTSPVAPSARRDRIRPPVRLSATTFRRGIAMTTATTLLSRAGRLYVRAETSIDKLQSLFALGVRLYLARVFIGSGLTKLHDWNITLALFENEYHVPVLSP